MTTKPRHLHSTLERVLRRLGPSAESFAAAAALHGPELLLQLEAARVAGQAATDRLEPCRAR